MDKKEKEGILLVLLCVFMHGAQPVLGKFGVSLLHPLFFGAITNLIAALALIFIIIIQKKQLLTLIKNNLFYLLCIGFFGTTLSNILFFYGVRLTSGINSAILLQVEPIYSLFIGYLLLNERISCKQIISTLIIVTGTLLVIYKGTVALNWGDLLIIGTPLCYQIGHFFSKKLLLKNDLNPLFIAAGRTLYGGTFLMLISHFAGTNQFHYLKETSILKMVIFFGIVIYALTYYIFYESIKRINLSKATAIISVYPVISIILAWFILRELPDFYQIGGFSLVFLGILSLSTIKSELKK